MNWHFIGYRPKRRMTRAQWVSPYPENPVYGFPIRPPVEEICSVSNCIAKGPTKEVMGVCNEYGCYASPASALQAVADEQGEFSVYAYRLGLALFRDGNDERLEPTDWFPLDLMPVPDTFERLGYDAVELSNGCSFFCSPLSCNHAANMMRVNRYCLVDSETEGIEIARLFSQSKPEPGPYCAIEVWRDKSVTPVA